MAFRIINQEYLLYANFESQFMDTTLFTTPININNTAETETAEDEHFLNDIAIIVSLLCIYTADIFVIFANIFVISAFASDRALQVPRNFYICNLAVCDLVIGLFIVPFYSSTIVTGDWVLGVWFCIVWNVLNNIVLAVSHLSILLIAYDRYMLVSDVVKYNNTETAAKAKLRVGICWISVIIVKVLFVLLSEYYFHKRNDPERASCSPLEPVIVPYIIGVPAYDVIFTLISMVIEVFMPLVFIAVFHWRVLHSIQRKERRTSAMSNLIQGSVQFQVMADVNLRAILHSTPLHTAISRDTNPQATTSQSPNPSLHGNVAKSKYPNTSAHGDASEIQSPNSSAHGNERDFYATNDHLHNVTTHETLPETTGQLLNALTLSKATNLNGTTGLSSTAPVEAYTSNQDGGTSDTESSTPTIIHDMLELQSRRNSTKSHLSQNLDTNFRKEISKHSKQSQQKQNKKKAKSKKPKSAKKNQCQPLKVREPREEELSLHENKGAIKPIFGQMNDTIDYQREIREALRHKQVNIYQCLCCKEYIALVSSARLNHFACNCGQSEAAPCRQSKSGEIQTLQTAGHNVSAVSNLSETLSRPNHCPSNTTHGVNEEEKQGYYHTHELDCKISTITMNSRAVETSTYSSGNSDDALQIEDVATKNIFTLSDRVNSKEKIRPNTSPCVQKPRNRTSNTWSYSIPMSYIRLPRSVSQYFDDGDCLFELNSTLDVSSELTNSSKYELDYCGRRRNAVVYPGSSDSDDDVDTRHMSKKEHISVSEKSPGKSVRFRKTTQTILPPRLRGARRSVLLMNKYRKKFDRRAAITITLLILFFVIFKLPLATVMIIAAVCQDCIGVRLLEGFTWMFWAKSLINPFLYAFISKRFRWYSVAFFRKTCPCVRNRVVPLR